MFSLDGKLLCPEHTSMVLEALGACQECKANIRALFESNPMLYMMLPLEHRALVKSYLDKKGPTDARSQGC